MFFVLFLLLIFHNHCAVAILLIFHKGASQRESVSQTFSTRNLSEFPANICNRTVKLHINLTSVICLIQHFYLIDPSCSAPTSPTLKATLFPSFFLLLIYFLLNDFSPKYNFCYKILWTASLLSTSAHSLVCFVLEWDFLICLISKKLVYSARFVYFLHMYAPFSLC